jgi:hypothetical protein
MMNFGGMRSFDIPVSYIAMDLTGSQHCVVRCDECVKLNGVGTRCDAYCWWLHCPFQELQIYDAV